MENEGEKEQWPITGRQLYKAFKHVSNSCLENEVRYSAKKKHFIVITNTFDNFKTFMSITTLRSGKAEGVAGGSQRRDKLTGVSYSAALQELLLYLVLQAAAEGQRSGPAPRPRAAGAKGAPQQHPAPSTDRSK